MSNYDTDREILYKLVGAMDENKASAIRQKIDCFLHPRLSIFIPSSGHCEYAITPSHIHPAYSFIYYFQPVPEFIVEDNIISYDLSEGRCLYALSPDIPHQEVVQDTFQSYIAILIERKLFEKILLKYINSIPILRGETFKPHPELLGLLKSFMLEASEYKSEVEVLDNLVPVITHFIARTVVAETFYNIPLYERFEVDRTISFMNSHFSEKITVDILAAQVNLSPGHFSKTFKMVTGSTPIDYLKLLRLQKARNLLISNVDNMTEIALQCGFSTSSYFSTCFIEKYKMTPSIYRQTFQHNNKT